MIETTALVPRPRLVCMLCGGETCAGPSRSIARRNLWDELWIEPFGLFLHVIDVFLDRFCRPTSWCCGAPLIDVAKEGMRSKME